MTDNVTSIEDRAAAQTNNGANADEVKKILVEADRELTDLEAQMDELRVKRKEIRARVKGAGMSLGRFDWTRKMRDLDKEDRDERIDEINLCWDAFGVDGQGQLFPDRAA